MYKAVSMGSDDVKTFDELLAMGIKIDVRKVPTDSPENFDEILKKAKKNQSKFRGRLLCQRLALF